MNTTEKFLFTELSSIINKLDENRKPVFGQMTPQHMIEHLGGIFLISAGKVNVKHPDTAQVEKYYSWFRSPEFTFKPNTQSPAMPSGLPPLRFDSLEAAKMALRKAVQKFKMQFEEQPQDKVVHPVFGPLDYQEWLRFHQVHTQHHLDQFELS